MVKKTAKTTNYSIAVYNEKGELDKPFEVGDKLLADNVNDQIIKQTIRIYLANQKAKKAQTKTRGEVRGGGRKPWRQKGTGRARQGSIRAPHWRGGGIVFGPRAHDATLTLNKKMKKKAMLNAITYKIQKVKIISQPEVKKTKDLHELLSKVFDVKKMKKAILILEKGNQIFKLGRNLPYVKVLPVENLSVFEVLNAREVVFEKQAFNKLLSALNK
ncbi:50S ribosomal protein L4 [Candidatus Microgenomates bacterium]|nr:50S ribosomal protein L4 [Candidatus Microgenomates bacterium]